MKNIENNLIYIDKKRIKDLTGIFLGIFLFFFIAMFINFEATNYIMNVTSTIVCLATMILAFITSNYYKNEFFIFTGIAFLIIGVMNVLHIVPKGEENNLIMLIFNKNCFDIGLELCEVFFVCISYSILVEKRSFKGNKLLFLFLSILAVFFQVKLNYLSKVTNILSELVITVISLSLLFYTFHKIKNKKTFLKNKICYFKFFIIIMIAIDILNFIMINKNMKLITFLSNFLSFYAYAIMFLVIFEKLFNNPYNMLFDNLYRRNEELYKINKNIENKNMQLQNKQLILKTEEQNYKNLFYSLPMPMIIINKINNRVVYANKSFKQLLRIDNLKDIINKNIYNLITFKSYDLETVNESALSFEAEVNFEDEIIYLDVRESMNYYNKDETIFIFQNITEDKKIESMKLNIEKKRLEQKIRSDFLSSISHDLKTPVNVIYSSMQLQKILLDNDNFESIKKYNLINKDNCMTLIRLTNNLIDSSKINYDYLKPQLEEINIVELIEDIVTHMSEYSKRNNSELIFDTDEEEIMILCDRNFMERVILNLISNSIKYTNKGNIWLNIKIVQGYVKIEVIDNGTGMDEEFLKVAFDKYSKGENAKKSTYKSSGIGLYVVKSLVELQGGKIEIESKKNHGTKITITFVRED